MTMTIFKFKSYGKDGNINPISLQSLIEKLNRQLLNELIGIPEFRRICGSICLMAVFAKQATSGPQILEATSLI